jgi:hypothetical protein
MEELSSFEIRSRFKTVEPGDGIVLSGCLALSITDPGKEIEMPISVLTPAATLGGPGCMEGDCNAFGASRRRLPGAAPAMESLPCLNGVGSSRAEGAQVVPASANLGASVSLFPN